MTFPSYIVRDARVEDVRPAAALAAELVRFHHDLDADRFAILADPIEPGYARYLGSLVGDSDGVFLVAEHKPDAAVVGYAFGTVEERSWPDLLAAHGRFHDLFVHPNHRGHGVGRSLAAAVLERFRARRVPRVVLSAAAKNPGAQRLFESLGFRPTMVEMTRTLSL